MHILFRIECVDEGVAGAVTVTSLQGCVGRGSGRREIGRVVYGLHSVEREGRQKDQESGSREQGTPSKD